MPLPVYIFLWNVPTDTGSQATLGDTIRACSVGLAVMAPRIERLEGVPMHVHEHMHSGIVYSVHVTPSGFRAWR